MNSLFLKDETDWKKHRDQVRFQCDSSLDTEAPTHYPCVIVFAISDSDWSSSYSCEFVYLDSFDSD